MGDHAKKSESETMKVNEEWKSLTESIVNNHDDRIKRLEDQMNALEKAFEKLLNNAEEKGLNLHGGDGEWY